VYPMKNLTRLTNFVKEPEGRLLWALHNSGARICEKAADLTEKQKLFLAQAYYQELREEREFIAKALGAEIKESGVSESMKERAKRLARRV